MENSFNGRILLNCTVKLRALKRDTDLIQWLKQEGITINCNPLGKTLRPHPIDFLTYFIAQTDQTAMYEVRIMSATTDSCGPFFSKQNI
jgi:hypothetical protein